MVSTGSITRHDTRAARVASVVHDALNPVQTILFGSRARGDYRWYSDIDIFVITADETEPDYREYAKSVAEQARKELLPEADKTDVICWTLRKFLDNRCLKNNLANHVARDGLPIMPPEEIGYSSDHGAESIDWNNVRTRVRDSKDNAYAIQHTVDSSLTPEKVLGHIAQQALEHGYKAALGANGHDYPVGWRGHDLAGLIALVREKLEIPAEVSVPGEEYSYLTEFAGSAIYADDLPPLNREAIHRDIPAAVEQLMRLIAETSGYDPSTDPELAG